MGFSKIRNYKRSVARSVSQHLAFTVKTAKVKRKRIQRDDTQPMFEEPKKTIAEIALKHVEIWTDGGCWPNPGGAGAWAAVMKFGEHRRELSGAVAAPTTNNRCELLAVIEALKTIKQVVRITLHTDSMYVIHVLQSKKPQKLKNPDLVQLARKLAAGHSLNPIWVRGHNGDPENECCDRLCNEQRKAVPVATYTPPKITNSIQPYKTPMDVVVAEPGFQPPKPFLGYPSHHTLENNEARRERERLQMEVDRAIGF